MPPNVASKRLTSGKLWPQDQARKRLFLASAVKYQKMADAARPGWPVVVPGRRQLARRKRGHVDRRPVLQEHRLAIRVDHADRLDLRLDDGIGAEPERLLHRGYSAKAARVVDAAIERQDDHLERVRALTAAEAVEGDDDNVVLFEDAVDKASDQPLVILAPK